ncbi:MAG: DNA-directed RNA polymerase subunit beta, partial [Chloroflexota bacterium]
RVNPLGFIETPYWQVIKELLSNDQALVGRTLRQRVATADGEAIAEAGTVVSQELGTRLAQLSPRLLKIVPYVSTTIQYLTADKEEEYYIAQANIKLNNRQEIMGEHIEARQGRRYLLESAERVDFMDVSPKQIVSVATSLIPFLEHDDANRALMGSNMQRQAVPLLWAQAPIVGTGMERWIARDSGQLLFARRGGEVVSATNTEILVKGEDGEIDRYPLIKFTRTNQGTCINQRPVVNTGQRIRQGQLVADSSATDHGELALGQNLLVAFMFWEGYNFEDAIILNEKLVKEDLLTSVHIERFETDARETKLGEEEITRDIPNIGEESLRDLDEMGIIRVGAYVGPGDILVGKITPKGETELTAEEKLLRAIFGEKAQDVKDTSLRAPHGEGGRVIGVKVFSRDNHPELPPGVIRTVRVWIAQKRKISVGDKMAGRHGNKGVVSRILPQEDMPYLPDGRPIDIILNPIGVPSRMNLGQILETHLGWAAHTLNFHALCPVFQGANSLAIEDSLAQAWLVQQAGAVHWDGDKSTVNLDEAQKWLQSKGYSDDHVFASQPDGKARLVCLRLWLEGQGVDPRSMSAVEVEQEMQRQIEEKNAYPPIQGKVVLRDGRSGEPFDQPITVGNIYMMKLIHLVEDKIHARSIGPYSLITQQPLGGKAQFGGQRFGEMEVWALEAYGAAHTLQELLTVKSDDVPGRAKTYESLVKGEDLFQPGVPESFKVLSQELKSLGLALEIITEAEE